MSDRFKFDAEGLLAEGDNEKLAALLGFIISRIEECLGQLTPKEYRIRTGTRKYRVIREGKVFVAHKES